jgi:hypothetical protein
VHTVKNYKTSVRIAISCPRYIQLPSQENCYALPLYQHAVYVYGLILKYTYEVLRRIIYLFVYLYVYGELYCVD